MKNSKLAGLSEEQIRAAHHYQYDGSHPNPNECTLCCMASLLDLGASYTDIRLGLEPVALGRSLDRIPFWHPRFPAWFPGPGGATHPRAALKGLEATIRKLKREGTDYPWWPVLHSRQEVDDLQAALQAGHPSLIYGLGRSGIPHVVVPIAREEEGWLVLDPGFPRARNPMRWSEQQLMSWWAGYSIFYPRGTMISLLPDDYNA